MPNTSITSDTVHHVARLANLPIDKTQELKFSHELSVILDDFKKLEKLETEGIEGTSQVTGITNVMRDDEVDLTRQLTQEEALSNAKNTYNGFFVVHAVLSE